MITLNELLSDEILEYDVENIDDVREFIQYMREYRQIWKHP
jgi:hypothetical protein